MAGRLRRADDSIKPSPSIFSGALVAFFNPQASRFRKGVRMSAVAAFVPAA